MCPVQCVTYVSGRSTGPLEDHVKGFSIGRPETYAIRPTVQERGFQQLALLQGLLRDEFWVEPLQSVRTRHWFRSVGLLQKIY